MKFVIIIHIQAGVFSSTILYIKLLIWYFKLILTIYYYCRKNLLFVFLISVLVNFTFTEQFYYLRFWFWYAPLPDWHPKIAFRTKLIPSVISAFGFYVTVGISGHTSNYYFGAAQLINWFCCAAGVDGVAFSYFHAAPDQSVQKCKRTGETNEKHTWDCENCECLVFSFPRGPSHRTFNIRAVSGYRNHINNKWVLPTIRYTKRSEKSFFKKL